MRKLQLELMTNRLMQMQDATEVKSVANDIVQLLALEIRAMDKEMRIFSSEMLIKISQ